MEPEAIYRQPAARPKMPEGVRDRPAEVWEALIAIADAAGGPWPDRARAACRHFVANTEPDALSLGLRLLRDVCDAFGDDDRMHSAELIAALVRDPESEWLDLWGKPLDQRRLAKELKRYGVESENIRIRDVIRKGYVVDGERGLGQAWQRYLSSGSKRYKHYMGNSAGQSVADCSAQNGERYQRYANATPETCSEQRLSGDVADVADVAPTDGNAKPNGHSPVGFVPPSGHGRCEECGWHTPTQGHRDGCQRTEVRS